MEITENDALEIVKVEFDTFLPLKKSHKEYYEHYPLEETWQSFIERVKQSLNDCYGNIITINFTR